MEGRRPKRSAEPGTGSPATTRERLRSLAAWLILLAICAAFFSIAAARGL